MNRWIHRICTGALALSLALTLADCGGGDDDGGGGGGGGLRVFFGMNGEGSCTSVIVDIDLADADAILERDGDAVDCALDTLLNSNGCDVTFTELDDGERLRVTISGCTIPEVTNLFSCGFSSVDLSDLTTQVTAQCTCKVPGCDGTPPICVDEDSAPGSCESCVNGIDDDDNGLIDCDDPNCQHSSACESTTTSTAPPTSTTVTTSTTVSVSSSTSSTSTTLGVGPIEVNFALSSSSGPVGGLQFTVNYTSAPGQFVGMGSNVQCTNQVNGALFAPNDNDPIRKLTLGLVSLSGINAPADLVSCVFNPGTPVPVPANFTVVIDDATNPDGVPVDVDIDVTVVETP